MQPSSSMQVQPQPRLHRRRNIAILAAIAAVSLVVAALAILAVSPRTQVLAIEKAGISGAMVLVMNFNVSVRAVGPIPYEGLHLLVESLDNGSVYSESEYIWMQSINGTTDLVWHVGVAVSPMALTTTYFSYYFLLSVSGKQVDSRTVA